jgi:ABC-type dipeptide/oligopeptide/nickel transport system ATPase subunit
MALAFFQGSRISSAFWAKMCRRYSGKVNSTPPVSESGSLPKLRPELVRIAYSELSAGLIATIFAAWGLAWYVAKLVLADEPTGNLDRKNAREALVLIRETCGENGSALLLVSHDPDVLGGFEDVSDFAEINQALKEVAP